MPNPAGINQLAGSHAYGEVKKLTELKQAAPLSGAPVAGRALDAARRAQKQAVRGRPAQPTPGPASGPPPAPLAAAPMVNTGQQQAAQRAQVWTDLAATPGASDLVRFYAQQAQTEASGAQQV